MQLRVVVEPRAPEPEHAARDPQDDTADHLKRPGGVDEIRFVATLALLDRRRDTDIGKHGQANQKHIDQGHQTEGFGEKNAGEQQVRGKADKLRGGVAKRHPSGAADQPSDHI